MLLAVWSPEAKFKSWSVRPCACGRARPWLSLTQVFVPPDVWQDDHLGQRMELGVSSVFFADHQRMEDSLTGHKVCLLN